MLLDEIGTGSDQLGSTLLLEEAQAAANSLQAERHVGQMQLLAVGLEIGGDGALGQRKPGGRLVDHHDAGFGQLVVGEGFGLHARTGDLRFAIAPIATFQAGDHALDIEHRIGQAQDGLRLGSLFQAPAGHIAQLRLQRARSRTIPRVLAILPSRLCRFE